MPFFTFYFGPKPTSGTAFHNQARKHRMSDAHLYAERLLSKSEVSEEGSSREDGFHSISRVERWILAALAFFATSTLLLLVAYSTKQPSDQQCGRQLSVWSPLLDAVQYEEIDFVNRPEQPSIYRGAPTHELEREWEKLWFYGAVPIPENKMQYLNRTLQETWSTQPDGSGYRALIEVFHQLHCLDVIRQYTWRDYYAQHPETVSIPFLLLQDNEVYARKHTDHCIEALRLSIMCHGDVTPYLLKTDPNAPAGVDPDFSPHHKCVKFDPLVEFMNGQKYKVESHNPHRL
ncbi:hypothetical protein B0O99DRAFT_685309 [Bisporella sp. PMI_857]|nr:hypothetical protein B0O99DRAFT_685309 [Bisporella sp. PMI_857]